MEKGLLTLFRRVHFNSRDSRDFRESRDSREPSDCGKPRRIRPFPGNLENLEILGIPEIPPVKKKPFPDDPFLSSRALG